MWFFLGAGLFDASQYAFFGNDVVEEVELGGLEDEDEELPVAAIEEDFAFDKEEVIPKTLSLYLPCLLVGECTGDLWCFLSIWCDLRFFPNIFRLKFVELCPTLMILLVHFQRSAKALICLSDKLSYSHVLEFSFLVLDQGLVILEKVSLKLIT